MKRLFFLFLIQILICVTGYSFVIAAPVDISKLIREAEAKELSSHPYWMSLMHYRQKRLGSKKSYKSEIITPEFFISKDGAEDSLSELKATLAAFFEESGKVPDSHAQCRFVARYKWLRENLDWTGFEPPQVTCEKFEEWSMHGAIESLSMVFVTGYLGNPASFYGHILLKFNTNREASSTHLLDPSMNYGAILGDDNAIVYILKGLFGGYGAGFSDEKFYRHNHNYGERELRDMWEYKLALTDDEIERLVSHSWELLGNKFTYYFLKENCAYRMAELLELVVDEPLLNYKLPWSVPSVVFDRLMLVRRDGMPVVKEVGRISSRQNRLYTKYFSLDGKQKEIVKELIDSSIDLENRDYRQQSGAEKIKVVETLFDYYEFRISNEDDDANFKEAKRKLLIERLALRGKSPVWDKPDPLPPHHAQRPGMTRFSSFYNTELGLGFELRLRPVYYDLLSLGAGRLPNSNVTMLDFTLAYADDEVWLKALDIVNIETLNLSRTGLPGEGGLAWKMRVGMEGQDLSCNDCAILVLNGGVGKGFSLANDVVLYGMLEAKLQTKHDDSGVLGGKASVALVASPFKWWKTRLLGGYRAYVDDTESGEAIFEFENRFGESRDWDVRLSYERDVEEEMKASLSLYW